MDQGSTAFVLICAALAFLAGLALPFAYGPGGGSATRPSRPTALVAVAVIVLLGLVVGYAEAFGSRFAPGFVGIGGVLGIDTGLLGLGAATDGGDAGGALALIAFQCALAAAGAGLVAAALSDRIGLTGSTVFVVLWSVLVYFPVVGWVLHLQWGAAGLLDGGWLVFDLTSLVGVGVIDFAGALPIHIAAGAAVLAIALARPAQKIDRKPALPSGSVPRTLIACALLWAGWFGVTAGAEGAADAFAALATVNVIIAPAASLLGWMVVERTRQGRPSATGAASGAVAGLVAVTAAGAFLTPLSALILGAATGALSAVVVDYLPARLRGAAGRIVAIHLVGGVFSILYLGVFATGVGLVYAGNPTQLIAQSIGVAAVLAYSFVVSYLLAALIALAEIRADSRRKLSSNRLRIRPKAELDGAEQ